VHHLFRAIGIATVVVAVTGVTVLGQGAASLDVFRIFLNDGRILSSYGEYARVDDDLVFVVTQGQDTRLETHDLITVPVAKVNMTRTLEYASAIRAARYGATRGEREYQALTADISRALQALQESDDKDRRLGIALVARRRLLAWSTDHFGYRAGELRQLVSLFDEVILELQAAAGVSKFSIDLVANVSPSPAVPLLLAPTVLETVASALAAASVTEVGVEKLALLRSADRVVAAHPELSDELRVEVARLLAEESELETTYRTMIRSALTRADLAVRQGRPAIIRRLIQDLEAADARLGYRRQRDVAAALRTLWSESGLAVDQKTALDRWDVVKDQLHAYDRRARSVLRGWDSHEEALLAVQEGRPVSPASLDAAARRFSELAQTLASLTPPDEMLDVNTALRSACQLPPAVVRLA
jgi:hypothetical protein